MKIHKRRIQRPSFAEFIKTQLETAQIEQVAEATSLDCNPSTFRGYLCRNSFPQHVGIALFLRYASKGMTLEAYEAQPRNKREVLTRGLIQRIENKYRITWCDERKHKQKSQPKLPSTLFDAFTSLDKSRGKSDDVLKTLGNQALSLIGSLQQGDFVVFLGSDSVPCLSAKNRADWEQALTYALDRQACVLFIQPSAAISVTTNGSLKKLSMHKQLQAYRMLRSQLASECTATTALDAQMDQYLIDPHPYCMPGFAITVFGTTHDDEQTVLRCCVRLPGDRLGNNLLYPSCPRFVKQLESLIYQVLLTQGKNLARSCKNALGKRKRNLLVRLQFNRELLRLFEGSSE